MNLNRCRHNSIVPVPCDGELPENMGSPMGKGNAVLEFNPPSPPVGGFGGREDLV